MNVYEETIITLLNYISEIVNQSTYDLIKKKIKNHCEVFIGKGNQVESYQHLQSILEKVKYSDRQNTLMKNLSNGSPHLNSSIRNLPTDFQLHHMKGKELKLSLNLHTTKHQSKDNLYAILKRNKSRQNNAFGDLNSGSDTRKNNETIPSPNLNYSTFNHNNSNKPMMIYQPQTIKSTQLNYHFKTPHNQTIQNKADPNASHSAFNYFSNLIKRNIITNPITKSVSINQSKSLINQKATYNQVKPSPQLVHSKSIKLNTLPHEINVSPIKIIELRQSPKTSLQIDNNTMNNMENNNNSNKECDSLKEKNVELLSQVKSSLDENLKVMFNFSYENFLNKESGRESKISNEDY